jgi:uncharacterized membrane protein
VSEELTPPNDPDSADRIEAYEASVSSTWRGPLPPPHLLREYNEAFPGCAERIVAMAEAESRSRHEADRHERDSRRLVIESDVFSQKAGLILAFLLAVFVIGIGAFLLYTGNLAWGAGIVGFPLIALISLFIYGKQQQSADLERLTDLDRNAEEAP